MAAARFHVPDIVTAFGKLNVVAPLPLVAIVTLRLLAIVRLVKISRRRPPGT